MEEHNELIQRLGKKLSKGVTNWVLSLDGPRYHASYVRMLRRELAGDIHKHLTENYAAQLRSRGITPVSSEKASIILNKVLLNTRDLHHRLLTAPDPDGIVADGRFSLGALIDNQDSVADSLTMQAQDGYEQDSFEDSIPYEVQADDFDPEDPPSGFVGFTGRRMWNTEESKDSRHMDLDGMVVGPDETFTMPDGDEFYGPRADPTNVAQSSNCQCSLTYEYSDNGETDWR